MSDEAMRRQYEYDRKVELDYLSSIRAAEKRGIESGKMEIITKLKSGVQSAPRFQILIARDCLYRA